MDFNQIISLEQKQQLSQQQIQSLNILAMNNYDLSRFLQEQALVNPLINLEEASPSSSGSDIDFSANSGNVRERVDIPEVRSRIRKSNEADEGFFDIPDHRLKNAATYLQDQLNHNLYTHREEYLLYFLTELIDDNGYLRHTLNELTYMTGYPVREVKHAVRIIQSLSPSGVGAYNLQECLLLQAKLLFPTQQDLHMMISTHLENLAAHQYQCISDDMALPLNTVKEYGSSGIVVVRNST